MMLVLSICLAAAMQVLVASANLPAVRMIGYREAMRTVPRHVAEVFWVQNAFVVLTASGMAGLCAAFPAAPDGGSPLGRAISGFVAVVWAGRLKFQLFVYDQALRQQHRAFDVLFVAAFA